LLLLEIDDDFCVALGRLFFSRAGAIAINSLGGTGRPACGRGDDGGGIFFLFSFSSFSLRFLWRKGSKCHDQSNEKMNWPTLSRSTYYFSLTVKYLPIETIKMNEQKDESQ
jgi:hypothetical protein